MNTFNKIFYTAAFIISTSFAVTACKDYVANPETPTAPTKKRPASDGYYFEKPQIEQMNFQTVVVTHETFEALQREAKLYGQKGIEGRDIIAFSIIYPREKLCVVHIYNPKKVYMPEFIGHEFTHCIYGNFHKSQP